MKLRFMLGLSVLTTAVGCGQVLKSCSKVATRQGARSGSRVVAEVDTIRRVEGIGARARFATVPPPISSTDDLAAYVDKDGLRVGDRARTEVVEIGNTTKEIAPDPSAGLSAPAADDAQDRLQRATELRREAQVATRRALDAPSHGSVGGLDDADRLAAKGNLRAAAAAYQRRASARPQSATDFARRAVVRAVQRRPAEVLAALKHLEGHGKELSSALQSAVSNAARVVGTENAQRLVLGALQEAKLLGDAGVSLVVHRGRLTVVRDIETLSSELSAPALPWGRSNTAVYIDDRFRAGREGLLAALEGDVARVAAQRSISIEQLAASEIGAVDRIVEKSTGTAFDLVQQPAAVADRKFNPIVLLRQIDKVGASNERSQSSPQPVRPMPLAPGTASSASHAP